MTIYALDPLYRLEGSITDNPLGIKFTQPTLDGLILSGVLKSGDLIIGDAQSFNYWRGRANKLPKNVRLLTTGDSDRNTDVGWYPKDKIFRFMKQEAQNSIKRLSSYVADQLTDEELEPETTVPVGFDEPKESETESQAPVQTETVGFGDEGATPQSQPAEQETVKEDNDVLLKELDDLLGGLRDDEAKSQSESQYQSESTSQSDVDSTSIVNYQSESESSVKNSESIMYYESESASNFNSEITSASEYFDQQQNIQLSVSESESQSLSEFNVPSKTIAESIGFGEEQADTVGWDEPETESIEQTETVGFGDQGATPQSQPDNKPTIVLPPKQDNSTFLKPESEPKDDNEWGDWE